MTRQYTSEEIQAMANYIVNQYTQPIEPARPVTDDMPLTPLQQEVARWAGMTDDEYKQSLAKINQQRGK